MCVEQGLIDSANGGQLGRNCQKGLFEHMPS